jgi:hypothetical protein
MATLASTLVYSSLRTTADGVKVPSSKVYTFASGATGTFTEPINLEGAKSVWVSSVAVQAMAFYLPSYSSGGAEMSDTSAYKVMTASSSGTGMDVVAPSGTGAGFISGALLPPHLSVSITGATTTIVTMVVNY